MSDAQIPLFRAPDEQRRLELDLMKRLLATIEKWGNALGQKDAKQMHEFTVNALLRTVAALCVYTELSSSKMSPESVQAFFRKINREGPIAEEEEGPLLAMRARRDLLLEKLEKTVRAF